MPSAQCTDAKVLEIVYTEENKTLAVKDAEEISSSLFSEGFKGEETESEQGVGSAQEKGKGMKHTPYKLRGLGEIGSAGTTKVPPGV